MPEVAPAPAPQPKSFRTPKRQSQLDLRVQIAEKPRPLIRSRCRLATRLRLLAPRVLVRRKDSLRSADQVAIAVLVELLVCTIQPPTYRTSLSAIRRWSHRVGACGGRSRGCREGGMGLDERMPWIDDGQPAIEARSELDERLRT